MTCYTALLITNSAWLLFAAIGVYAMRCQAKWMADYQGKDQEDHHG